MTVFHKRPLALGIFLFLSVLLFLIWTEEYVPILFLSALLFALCAVFVIFLYKTNQATVSTLRGRFLLLGFSLFVFLFSLFFAQGTLIPAQQMRNETLLTAGKVLSVATDGSFVMECEGGTKVQVTLTEDSLWDSTPKENLLLQARLSCQEQRPAFSLRKNGVLVTAELVWAKSSGVAEKSLTQQLSEALREGFSFLKYRHLADALFLGNDRLNSPSLEEALAVTQTQHLLSVSGLHVSLLLFSVENYLERLRLPRRILSVALAGITLLYMALLDFAPSVSRAGLMTGMALAAKHLRKNNDSITSLLFSALILCCTDPFVLFDVSFQLSFLSTLGILRIYLPQGQRMEQSRRFQGSGFWSALAKHALRWALQGMLMTFCALVFALPVLLGLSPRLNVWAFVPNLLLIPLFTPALTAVFAYLPLALLLSAFGGEALVFPLAKACDLFLLLFDTAAQALGQNDLSCIISSQASQEAVFFLSVFLASALCLIPDKRRLFLCVTFVVTLPLLLVTHGTIQGLQKAKICVLTDSSQPAFLIESKDSSLLWLPRGCTRPGLLLDALEDRDRKNLDAVVVSDGNAEQCLFYLSAQCHVKTLYVADPSSYEGLQALCQDTHTRLAPLPDSELSEDLPFCLRYTFTKNTLSLDVAADGLFFSYRWGYTSFSRTYDFFFEGTPDLAVFSHCPSLLFTQELKNTRLFANDGPKTFSDRVFSLSDSNRLTLCVFSNFSRVFYRELAQGK